MTVEQRKLVDEHRSQGEARGVGLSLRGHWTVSLEDGLEMLVEVLDRYVTQPVKDPSDLYPSVGLRVEPRPPLATKNLSLAEQAARTSGAL